MTSSDVERLMILKKIAFGVISKPDRDPHLIEIEYDENNNISRLIITNKKTGKVKIVNLTYDENNNLVKIDEEVEE